MPPTQRRCGWHAVRKLQKAPAQPRGILLRRSYAPRMQLKEGPLKLRPGQEFIPCIQGRD
eukprot:scaffold2326_cov286-Pinguiococcus_pyrenoidosus.AAC.4